MPDPPIVTIVDPREGQVFSGQCLLNVTVDALFDEYGVRFEADEYDFMFVLDRSGSMAGSDPQDFTKQAAVRLLDSVPGWKSVASGVVVFLEGRVTQSLTTNLPLVRSALIGLPDQSGGTDIAGGLRAAREEFEVRGRADAAKFMVLISDGGSDAAAAMEEADRARWPIHTFHIGSYPSPGALLLQQIAERTGGNFINVTDPADLPTELIQGVNTFRAKVSRVEVASSASPDTIVSARQSGSLWIAENVQVFGPTTMLVRACTNENPPRCGEKFLNVVARTGQDTVGEIRILQPTVQYPVSEREVEMAGDVGLYVNATLASVPIVDPCLRIEVDRIETTSTAALVAVFVTKPFNGLWHFPAIPVRTGPGQATILTATAVTTDYPPKRFSASVTLFVPTPCRSMDEVITRLDGREWEGNSHIIPFEPFSLSDTDAGLRFDLPGPVAAGFFGFFQSRDALCPAPEGLNVLRVPLTPHRASSLLLPDCRVRVFHADNSRSFYCRVNELNGRPLPAFIDVPFMSDGASKMRVAVDLLAFDRKNGGGWTCAEPLQATSSWSHAIHSPVGGACAASFLGESQRDSSGISLTRAGDVNADGFDDFLLGARNSSKYQIGAGKAYLILGKGGPWTRWSDLWLAPASFLGEGVDNFAGSSVAGAGDVNGDGYADFLVGAPENGEAGFRAGKVYLFLGRPDGWGGERSLATADATFLGERVEDRFGLALAGAGDVNGDGFDDFLIAAPHHSNSFYRAGKVYLFFGKASGWSHGIAASAAPASFTGESTNDYAGTSLAGAGDVNGDTYDDILIGAPGSDSAGLDAGQAYLLFGRARGWVKDYPLDGSAASFTGEQAGDEAGTGLSAAGDVNHDGFADFLVGAPFNDQAGNNAGQAYLIFGKSNGWTLRRSLASADASFLGESALDQAGFSVGAAGDVNGDGFDDLLIGAIHASNHVIDSGAAYLLMGAASGWTRQVPLSAVDYSFHGERPNDLLGFQATGAGDVNDDGFEDFVLGAPGNSEAGLGAGHSYLVLGSANGPRYVAGTSPAPPSLLPKTANASPDQANPLDQPDRLDLSDLSDLSDAADSREQGAGMSPARPALPAGVAIAPVEQALGDLNETSWEPWRHIPPFQPTVLTDTQAGLSFQVMPPMTAGYFAFYQTREIFPALPAGPHTLRFHLQHSRPPGLLLPDIRVRVFASDNSIAWYARYTEAAGGTLPTVLDVPFMSDGIWPFRISIDLLSFDKRMAGGFTVTRIELDP